jgi:hypothetical protein
MARGSLVFCLMLTLLASGCADRQEVRPNPDRELADALAQQPVEQFRLGTWLKEHPVVKNTALVSLLVVVLAASVLATVDLCIRAAHGDPAALHALNLNPSIPTFQH